MKPALRDYLATLRQDSYVQVKPGYVDSAANGPGTSIQETAPTPDSSDVKKKKTLFGKGKNSGSGA